jgi:outer membrane lipoprotein-sorting protein
MTLRISLIAFISFCFLTMNAQDEQAKKILSDLSSKTKSYSTITASFSMTLIDQQSDLNIKKEGVINVQGNKYRVKLDKDIVIGNGATRWTFQAESNEVYIDDEANGEDETLNPSKIFTIWESGFKQKYEGLKSENGKNIHLINLYPIDAASKQYHTIKVYIDKDKNELVKVEVIGKEGEKYIYDLKSFKGNETLAASTFDFKPSEFPGANVVDMR